MENDDLSLSHSENWRDERMRQLTACEYANAPVLHKVVCSNNVQNNVQNMLEFGFSVLVVRKGSLEGRAAMDV